MSVPNAMAKIDEVLLMGPGPSCVHPAVYEALGRPTLGHMDRPFIAIMDEIQAMLREVMKTRNRLTLPISGTGSAGMETCFVNLVERGDPVLILSNGVFGERMRDVAERLGAQVRVLRFEMGRPVALDAVRQALAEGPNKIVAVIHAETSTGVVNPVAEIGAAVKPTGALYVVDAVTSLGGMDVRTDEWGIDAIYSGTQKCLSCPPGLAPVSFSAKALETLLTRKSKVPSWYLDLSMVVKYWEGASRVYHHTAPVNMLYGLHAALRLILEEGLDRVFARHRACHEQLVRGLRGMGLDMLVDASCRLPMLNAVVCPAGIDEAGVRKRLREAHRIEIGGGLGALAGKVWRIGLMGQTAQPARVERLMGALHQVVHAEPACA